MKKEISLLSIFLLLGCGGGSITKIETSDENNFSTSGVKINVLFKLTNPYTDIEEDYEITDIKADKCDTPEFNPVSFKLTSNSPTYTFTYDLTFLNTPCYTDKVDLYYKLNTVKHTKSIINPQYDQTEVYKEENNDPLYQYQWHLKNTGQDFGIIQATPGEDINVEPVWEQGITGKGVVVGVIDSGVDMFHPDLKDNIDWEDSYNYINKSQNTTPIGDEPITSTDSYIFAHGTAVAGIIAAKGWNGIGTRGVAPDAKIAAFNSLTFLEGQESEDALSGVNLQTARILDSLVRNLNHIDIYNNSWGGDTTSLLDDNDTQSYDIQTTYGVKFGRDGKGAVYVKAAGNEGNESNANYEQFATNGNWIVVGALGADGKATDYSTPGSAILVSAPGGGVNSDYVKENLLEIVTTDLAGDKRGFDRIDDFASIQPHFDVKGNENYDYTYRMNGTSAAAPIISGVVALMLEANPNLTYRDIQIILAKTARKNDPNDSEWRVNAAGLHFNYKYGFGAVDAEKAVTLAKLWQSVGGYKELKT